MKVVALCRETPATFQSERRLPPTEETAFPEGCQERRGVSKVLTKFWALHPLQVLHGKATRGAEDAADTPWRVSEHLRLSRRADRQVVCEGGRLRASRRLPPFASPAALRLAPLHRAAVYTANLVRFTFTFSVLTDEPTPIRTVW